MRFTNILGFRFCVFGLSIAAGSNAGAQDDLEPGRPLEIRGVINVPQAAEAPPAPAVNDHVVRLPAGARVMAGVQAPDIDPVLEVVEQSSGQVVAADDDGGQGLNSLTTFAVRNEGAYVFRVRNFQTNSGPYILSIETLPALPDPGDIPSPTIRMAFSVQDGDLAAEDARSNAYFDDYDLPLGQGGEVLVRLFSADFDPSIAIVRRADREGPQIAFSNDLAGTGGALLLFRAETTDDYVVRVTSAGDQQTGRYRLWVGRVTR